MHTLTLAAALALAAAGLAQNPSVTLDARKDNTLYFLDPVTGSNGAGTRMFCGTDLSASPHRALMAFDIRSQVPAGSTIVSARLELTVAQTLAVALPCDLHRLTSDWGEQGSLASGGQGGGGTALPGDATWDYAFWPTTPWQTVGGGGDFVATASASTVVGQVGRFSWSSAQLTADVQSMLDNPSSNFGWVLITDEVNIRTARAFHTREALNAPDRPALLITYLPPTAAVTAFGNGCNGGSGSVLALSANGLPSIPNPGFALLLSGGPVGAIRAINLFALPQVPGLPIGNGCEILGDFNTLIIGLVTTGTQPLAIPNNTAFYGVELTAQGLSLDFVTGGIGLSNGLTLRLGT